MKFKHGLIALILPFCFLFALCGCKSEKTATLSLSESAHTVEAGETFTLQITQKECSGLTVTAADESVVQVLNVTDESVDVKGLKAGTTTVTARATVGKDTEITASCTVTVTQVSLKINLPEGKLVLARGASATVRAFADTSVAGNVVWESSDETLATVEYQGLIAIVTASSAKSGTCTVSVRCGANESSFELIVGKN